MSKISKIQSLSISKTEKKGASVLDDLDFFSLGQVCAIGFVEALSRIPEGVGKGRKICNEDLFNFFLDFTKLTEMDVDPYEFSFILGVRMDEASVPLTPIMIGDGEYEEIEGVDAELLKAIFH